MSESRGNHKEPTFTAELKTYIDIDGENGHDGANLHTANAPPDEPNDEGVGDGNIVSNS
jgi:hypothetical protein